MTLKQTNYHFKVNITPCRLGEEGEIFSTKMNVELHWLGLVV